MAKKRVSKKGAAAEAGSSKAQAIRDQFKAMNNRARPRDIIAALLAKGVEVSSAQVSTTLKALGARPRRRGRRGANGALGRPVGAAGRKVSAADLMAAKEFSDRLGGVTAARETLEILTRLR